MIDPNTLKASGNELVVSVLAGSNGEVGRVAVSDIVVQFQANVP